MTDFTAAKILFSPLSGKRIDVAKLMVHLHFVSQVSDLNSLMHVMATRHIGNPGVHYVIFPATPALFTDIKSGLVDFLLNDIRTSLDGALNYPDKPRPPWGVTYGLLGEMTRSFIRPISIDARNLLGEMGYNTIIQPDWGAALQFPPVLWGEKFFDQEGEHHRMVLQDNIHVYDDAEVNPLLIDLTTKNVSSINQ